VVVFAVIGVGYLVISHAEPLGSKTIVDVSSPQCGVIAAIGQHSNGIVGVNSNEGAFDGNSCLRNEVNHFNNFALYAVANWPSPHCQQTLHITSPFNCGEHAAAWAMGFAGSKHVKSSVWWIDVETGAGWGSNTSQNVQFLNGMFTQMASHGVKTVGFYSTQSQWNAITGGWRNNSPTWYATGLVSNSTPSSMKNYCKLNFTNSSNHFAQYINTSSAQKIDVDVQC
jgi:hypothetical protein